ncbi:hypothetical protein CJ738_36785, partial [Klebsiella pneumoniae]
PSALAWLISRPAVNLAAARRLLEALSALDASGCHDPSALAWLISRPAVNLAAARRLLEALSALDASG